MRAHTTAAYGGKHEPRAVASLRSRPVRHCVARRWSNADAHRRVRSIELRPQRRNSFRPDTAVRWPARAHPLPGPFTGDRLVDDLRWRRLDLLTFLAATCTRPVRARL